MAAESVRSIELRRLDELRKQAAVYGPKTDPSVLIEIRELETKYRDRTSRSRNGEDYDFLLNTVAAALNRVTVVEQRQIEDSKDRKDRQDQTDKRFDERDVKLDHLSNRINVLLVLVSGFGFIGIVALIVAIVVAVKVF